MQTGKTRTFRNRPKPVGKAGGDQAGANLIRAALFRRGLSMAAWAKKHGYSLPTVWTAAYQLRGGALATKIQAELEQLLNA
jgi:hypothetical protein